MAKRHTANWRMAEQQMANWFVWQTDYGELAYGVLENSKMTSYLAKHLIFDNLI